MGGDALKRLLHRWNGQPYRNKLLHRWNREQAELEANGAVLALEVPGLGAASRPRRRPAKKDAQRQAPARKGKGSKRKSDDLAKAPSSGDGGGGGAAPPPAPASRAPSALASSTPSLQQPGAPPRAADEDKDGGPVNGDTKEDGNDKKPLSALVQKHLDDPIIAEKIEILSQHYAHFRIIREDSSCFYRAFLFSYLENLGQLEDRKAEATRLMEHMATSKESFCGLELDQAYFSKPELSSVMAEFNIFLKSVAEGPSSDEQFKCCLQSMKSPRIISLLRLLAEFDIRTGGEEYESFYSENFDAILYCLKNVRPMGARAKVLAIRGLTFALDIPLRVEIVDGNLTDETAEVKSFDFFPRSESGTPEEMGSCGYLLSFDCTPLLTLMYLRNPKRWYILYRKTTSVP